MKRTQLISTADLTREEVDYFIREAETLRDHRTDDLIGRICASLFYEPSTRTRLSFESAMHRMGADIISVTDAGSSSLKKGETLEDTIEMVEKYADILVMRHPEARAAERAVKVTSKPFINAGDGANQHPTQALLDMYTIHREVGGIDGITVGFVGDLKYGRTVHSLIYLLSLYPIKRVLFISPEALKMPSEYLELLERSGIEYQVGNDLESAIPEMDVIYMTRIQEERFEHPEVYEKLKGSYVLTPMTVQMGKPELRILHPLPRIDEISPEVDSLPQAAYFRQAENGVYMRMALLKTLSQNYYS
jgi:aspartate carbamoyltransferase catalytic subunit